MAASEIEIVGMNESELFVKTKEEPVDTYAWYDIDVGMISSKMSYFFQNAKDSCYLPYMILFLTGIGLTPQQAGTINGLRFIGFVVGAPLWGILADYKQIHRTVIFILCVSSMISFSSMPFVSIPISHNKICDIRNNTGNQSSNSINMTTGMINDGNSPKSNRHLFLIMMIINLLANCFDGSTAGFVDSGVMQKISIRSRKAEFGTQRLFGAGGYGAGAFASSIAVEYFPKSYLPCYTSVFLIYGFFVLCLTVSTNSLFNNLLFSKDLRKRTESITSDIFRGNVNVGKILRETICEPNTIFFLFTVLVVGTIHTLYIGFLFILLRDINCPNIVMGLSIVVGAASSAIFIKLCENFIKVLGGTIRVLCLGCFSWAIRFILFAYLENPWVVLPIQLLQGFGYGLFIASSVVHIKQISSPEIYTSMYAIFNSLFFGTGAILGNVLGGALLMKFGIRTLFLGTSIAGFIWTFVMLVYLVVEFYQKRKGPI